MPRKTYKLTDETYEVLKGNEQSIAKEMECDPSYIYGIRNQEKLRLMPNQLERF